MRGGGQGKGRWGIYTTIGQSLGNRVLVTESDGHPLGQGAIGLLAKVPVDHLPTLFLEEADYARSRGCIMEIAYIHPVLIQFLSKVAPQSDTHPGAVQGKGP
jgi:hypothetical protein